MDALVMAGGKGTRLNSPEMEKPLVDVMGLPMIAHVVRELLKSKIVDIIVAVSPFTPKTKKWAENSHLKVITTPGNGYIEDYIWAVNRLQISKPVMIISADIPLVTEDIINKVIAVYCQKRRGALAVYVPYDLCLSSSTRQVLKSTINGIDVVPTGLNIIDGAQIDHIQEEIAFVLYDESLGVNVNRMSDLRVFVDFERHS